MSTALVLSPHLDDAAFSLGPLLAQYSKNTQFVIATAFTKSVLLPTGFALACQLDKGLSANEDYMAIRRSEDATWADCLNVKIVYGEFLEAPHRGYHSAKELFGSVLPEQDIRNNLRHWITELIKTYEPHALFCPLGIGHHVDHILIRETVAQLDLPNSPNGPDAPDAPDTPLKPNLPVYFFKDLPYASNTEHLSIQHYLNSDKKWFEYSINLSNESINSAYIATTSYKTQIPFQFGNNTAMKEKLENSWGHCLTIYSTDPQAFHF